MAEMEHLRISIFGALFGLLGVLLGILGTSVARLLRNQRHIQSELAASEKQHRQLLDDARDSIVIHDGSAILYANTAAAQMHGAASSNDLLGRNPIELVPPAHRDTIRQLRHDTLAGRGIGQSDDVGRLTLDGKIVHARNIGAPVEWDGKECILVRSLDLSESRRAQDAIEQSESRLTAFLKHAPVLTVIFDLDFRLVRTNDAYDIFFGIDGSKFIGQTDRSWLGEDLTRQYADEAADIIRNGTLFDRVIEMKDAKGQTRQLRQVKFPIDDGNGTLIAIGVVMTDITEQVLQSREMELARDQAEAANRAKSAFLANMSHEIRTPMNGVLGMADLLSLSDLSADQHRYLDTIRRSGETLLGIINNILDVSRIEAGEFALNAVSFDLHELVADTLEILAETASSKGLYVANYIAHDVPTRIIGDDVRLRQVLQNLLGNALKFTAQGSVIVRIVKIGGPAENPLLRFEVSDTGIGISREHQISLFDAFNQADDTITRRYGGTGLGLSIAQHIVNLMGGRIDVDSEPGRGSSFVFSVPLQADIAARHTDSLTRINLSKKRVLIVDDTPSNREILSEFAKGWGMGYVVAQSGADACQILEKSAADGMSFDYALIDIAMPGMDGIALANWIRADARFDNIALIGLTSFNLNRESDDFRNADFAEFVTKPVRRSSLMKTVAGATGTVGRDRTARAPAHGDTEKGMAPVSSDPRTPKATILLAEDNPVNQEVARQYLSRAGFDVRAAGNGAEALEIFKRDHIDLVLMDVQMPEMDGIQATTAIRELERLESRARVPIIAATAHAFQEDRDKCIGAGMDDFLSKPYTRKQLQPLLDRWLGSVTRMPADTPDAAEDTSFPAQPDGSDREAVLDDKILNQLRAMDADGSDTLLAKVAGLFLDTTPDQLAKLRDGVAAGDYTTLAEVSHGLKSSSANVAAIRLANLSRSLEQAAAQEDASLSGELVDEICREFDNVGQALAAATDIPSYLRKSA